MKICIVGAGAIGSALAARLATGGHEIAIIARGARRASLQQHGLVVVENGQTLQSRPALIGADALASQDLVITAVKSHSLPGLLPTLASAMGSQTRLIPAVNGMPFWYFQGEGGPSDGRPVASVDPGGRLARLLPARRIIGCVVYSRHRRTSGPSYRRHRWRQP
jgi:2-dehydropantoate 2-reductase